MNGFRSTSQIQAKTQSHAKPCTCLTGILFGVFLLAPTYLAAVLNVLGEDLEAKQLRCEYLTNPLGIDTPRPRLSWIVESSEHGQKQSAYQILVSSSFDQLMNDEGDFWDTGRVTSDESLHIGYSGKPLPSSQRVFWKVRVWDRDGKMSNWSRIAFWEMGLLKPEDWQAQWIGRTKDTKSHPAPLLRRAFELEGDPVRGTVYVCGLGYYELHLNGKTVSDRLLDPAFTRYDKRALYVTHDVTPFLKDGRNVIGVMLGNGWYNVHTKAVWNFHKAPWRAAPKVLLQLRLEFADGRVELIGTDTNWKTSTGPIVFDSIYGCETYDARLEKKDWDKADYDDRDWQSAIIVPAPAGQLAAQMMPSIKTTDVLVPVKLTQPKPGVFVYDIGQNLAGRAQLTVKGPAGTKVMMQYGERLHADGTLDTTDIAKHVIKKWPKQQFQTDTYILKGKGKETWHSRFTYHGFQYVQVTGYPGKPKLKNLKALFNHTAVPNAGQFECSNPLLNKIQTATRWSYLSNLQGIPTDCPHREKNGWTGDAHLAAEQAMFNFFPPAVYTKWIDDLADEQQPSGALPGIVPTSGWGYSWGNGPAWDSAFLLIPFYMYQYYGDAEILRQHFPGFRRYVDYLTSKAKNGIVDIGLNDWASFKTKTGAPITSTAYYYVDARITSLAAELSGDAEGARRYAKLANSIKKAFNRKLFHPNTGLYDNGSQTALSCALYQKLVEPEQRQRVLDNLIIAVEKNDNHIDTGILGAKYLLNSLHENNRDDVAYRIATQTDLPSWGWWIAQGATTLWEQWKGTQSRNHIMFGDISAWFYKAIAGINPDPDSPGFKHFIVKPQVLGDLTWAKADYDSIRGRIRSHWRIRNNEFRLELTVPANTSATVMLPAASADKVREGRHPATEVDGIKFLRMENNRAIFKVASGEYRFRVSLR
jgi:alpha-L-rhamnosidase